MIAKNLASWVYVIMDVVCGNLINRHDEHNFEHIRRIESKRNSSLRSVLSSFLLTVLYTHYIMRMDIILTFIDLQCKH